MKKTILFGFAMLVVAQVAHAGIIQNQTVIAGTLSNSAGFPLYTFEKDAPGISNCNGPCAAIWPPVLVKTASEVPSGFKTLKRQDGSTQLANDDGLGLYSFVQDTAGTSSTPATARGHGLRDFYLSAPVRSSK